MNSRRQLAPDAVRRQLLATGVGLISLSLTPSWWNQVRAATPADAPAREPLNRFPRMVQEYFVRRLHEAERTGEALRNALKTKEDAQQYVAAVREKIKTCFGPLPEKTPLNARITGTVDRDAYRIDK